MILLNRVLNAFSRSALNTRNSRGAAMVEMGLIIACITVLALSSVYMLGGETDKQICYAGNALGQVTGNIDEDCPIPELMADDGTTTGVGPEGFEDLYLALSETKIRQVLLPVKNFDITGMNEVIVSTDRPDSVAACYGLADGNVTCATMLGEMSAFDFPPNVVSVGYAILPEPDDRFEMAQPVSITLGARDVPELSQTWNIHAYRPAVANTFAPEFEFSDMAFDAGIVGEQDIIEALKGAFGPEPLSIDITPGEGAGKFAGCAMARGATDPECGLLLDETGSQLVPTNGDGIGYQVMLPRDARIPVSWPLHIETYSTFEPDTRKIWDVTVSRPAGEAPAFPDLPFQDTEFPADTDAPAEIMVDLDGSYPSDLMITIPQTDAGLRACYLLAPENERSDPRRECSGDAGEAEVKLQVPSDAIALGLLVDVPQDVLVEYARRAAFSVSSVDYPDFSRDFDIAITRPAFVPMFEPAFTFSDVTFEAGLVDWQPHLVEMAGAFNDNLVLSLPNTTKGLKVCYQMVAEGQITCSTASNGKDNKAIELTVPSQAYALGFSMDLGESAFVDVSSPVAFTLTHARDASLTRSYAFTAQRPAMAVVFEPDLSGVSFVDEAWPEATEGWQSAQMSPLAGTFNSDLMISLPAGTDAGGCYLLSGAEDPVCSDSALEAAVDFRIPAEAVSFGVRSYMSDALYTDMDRTVGFTLRSAESLAPEHAVAFSYQVTRPAVPVRFDPSLGFRDKTFEEGTRGTQYVMVPIEGEITTGLVITMPQADQSLRACYVATAGDPKICSNENARDGDVLFTVPRNAAKVGYQVVVPQDRYVDWSLPVTFNVASDADAQEALSYDIAVQASRSTTPVEISPSFTFEDITFEAGTTGAQSVLMDLQGKFTTELQVAMQMTGHAISPCLEQYAGKAPECSKTDTQEASAAVRAKWTTEAREAEETLIHGAGYRVVLPENIHEAVEWPVTLSLVSVYDPTVSAQFDFTIRREAVPVIWSPDPSLQLPDATFPVRATGARDEIVPFIGEFTTDTDFTIATSGLEIHPCYQQVETGAIDCGDSSESANAMVRLSPDWVAIGYRIVLPDDLAQEVDKEVQVDLRSSQDASLARRQSFRVYREPAPVVFSPSVTFPDQEFQRGETEWQYNLQPLSGDLTTTLELVSDAPIQQRLCARDTPSADLRCTDGNPGREQLLTVPPTAYQIGAALYLPEEPQKEDRQAGTFSMRMKDFPSQSRDYSYQTFRRQLDIQFSPSIAFADETLPVDTHDWQTFTRRLSGSFSTDLQWVTSEPGSDLRLCAQETSSSPTTCAPAGEGRLDLVSGTYAIGYAVDVSDDLFHDYTKTLKLRLQSTEAETVGADFTPRVRRPKHAVEYPMASQFPDQHYPAGMTGEKTVMTQLGGVGNTPMTLTLAPIGQNARLCIQATAQSAIACKATSAEAGAQSYDFTSDTYAVGYKISLPQDPFETVSYTLGLSVGSQSVPEDDPKQIPVRIERDVQQPVLPGPDFFANKAFAPGKTGQQVVMTALPAGIDTNLILTKGSKQSGLGLCYQTNRNSDPVCVSDGSTRNSEIQDKERSWYAIGYRIDLGSNIDEEVHRGLNLVISSQAVPQASQAYHFQVTRMPMDAVMPDRTFFSDQTFDAGLTGPKTVMVSLGETNVDLVLHKAAGQAGLSLCYREFSYTGITCKGADSDAEYSIPVSKNWTEIGYGFSLGDSKFNPVDETFNLSITTSDGWSNRIDYTPHVVRPHTEMIMPAADLLAGRAFPEGTTSTQTVWAILDPAINTDMRIIKPAGQTGMSICVQKNSDLSSRTCGWGKTEGEGSYNVDVGTYAVGYQVNVGETEYGDYDQTFALQLQSRDEAIRVQSYDIHVTRPGKAIAMPSATFFSDVEIPVNTTGDFVFTQDVAGFDPSPKKFTLTQNTEALAFSACTVSTSGYQNCLGTTNNSSPSKDIGDQIAKIGFKVTVPENIYATIDEPLQIRIESTADPSEVVTYNIRVKRPGAEVTLPPQDAFTDIVFDATEIGDKQIFIDPRPYLNSEVTLTMEQTNTSVRLCYAGIRLRCSNDAANGDTSQGYGPGSSIMGFILNVGDNKFQSFEKTLRFHVVSNEDPSKFVDYEITVSRPAVEVTMPPQDAFTDIVFDATEIGDKQIFIDPRPYLNSEVTLTMEQTNTSVRLCYAGIRLRCSNDAANGDTSQGYGPGSSIMGFILNVGDNKFQSFEKTLRFHVVSNEDPSKLVDYEITVSRPAVEVTLPPQDAFTDIVLDSSATKWQPIMIDPHDYLNSNVTISRDPADTYFTVCYENYGYYCDNASSNNNGEKSVSPSHNGMGYSVYTGESKFQSFNETLRFRITSNIDSSRFVDYAVNVSRPAVPATFPPQEAFPDIEIPSSDAALQYSMINIKDYLNTTLTMIMEPNDIGATTCYVSYSGGSTYCDQPVPGGTVARDYSTSWIKMGFRVDTGSNAEFHGTVRFRLQSKADPSQFRDYVVNVDKAGEFVKIPAQSAFPDIVLEPTQTGEFNFNVDIKNFLNDSILVSMQATDFPAGMCYEYQSQGIVCDKHPTLNRDDSMTLHTYYSHVGYFVDTGSDPAVAFEKTIHMRIESVSTPSRFENYDITITRPAAQP